MNGKSLKETCTPATISPAAPASKASQIPALCCVGVCYSNAGPESHGISVGSTHPHLYFLALFPISAVMCWAVFQNLSELQCYRWGRAEAPGEKKLSGCAVGCAK